MSNKRTFRMRIALVVMLMMAVIVAKAQSGRILVAVYSKTGNTMAVAQNIVELTGADLIEIIPAVPYPETYSETLPIATEEINNIDQYGIYPEILTTIESMDAYETVIVCSPIWWSRIATSMQSFLHTYSEMTDGKQMSLVVTSGATGIETAWGDLQRLCPNATLLGNGIRISASASHNAMNIVSEWLESIGLYDPTGIEENHDQTTPNATGVYTIDGRLLQRDDKNTESLKPGVYIINGKKQVITK